MTSARMSSVPSRAAEISKEATSCYLGGVSRLLRGGVLLVLGLLVLGKAGFSQCSGCGTPNPPDVMSGPRSLVLVLQRLGMRADLAELATLAGRNETGTTRAGLLAAVHKNGIQAVWMKIGVDELAKLSIPVVAYIWSNQFVVVQKGSTGLNIIDPSKPDQPIPVDEFRARYSGFALLVSRDKSVFRKPDVDGPDMRLDNYSLNLGFSDEGTQIEREIRIRNVGNADLIISDLRSTCGCVTARMHDKIIPPGRMRKAVLVFDTKQLTGAQTKYVYFQSNDPVSGVMSLGIDVFVRPSKVLVSRAVSLGDVRLRQRAKLTIYVRDPGDGSLKVDKVVSDSPILAASLSRCKPADTNYPGYEVNLQMEAGAARGEFRSTVRLFTNLPKEPVVTVLVTATITGGVEAFPEMLFFGRLKKGQEASKSVTVSKADRTPFTIGKVDSPFEYLTVSVSSREDTKSYTLLAILEDNAPVGYIKGDVVIHTNNRDQPEIRVPVYALVEDK